MKGKLIIFSMFSISILLTSCAYALTDAEKIRIFYKNDWLFFFGYRTNEVNEKTAIEDEHNEKPYLPLLSLVKINDQYRSVVKDYLDQMEIFIEGNKDKLKNFYNAVVDDSISEKQFIVMRDQVKGLLKAKLLPKLTNGIRCMVAIDDTQYIEVAKEIDKNIFAATVSDLHPNDSVYWFRYLQHPELMGMKREDILDSQGVIKYREFFYESNMKIRVIKQIRDEQGNYYGELYADYYKLDQFDKLFDEKGNPRNPKK
jgi:hypothetical protein